MAGALRNGRARVAVVSPPVPRAAIYTRKSSAEGLDREFTSLDNQRERAEAYVASQGWSLIATRYDDGGFSGGTIERPAFKHLLSDAEAGEFDVIVCYRLDRISRSLVDFVKVHEFLERRRVALVSVTESINTSTPHGRMMVNVLLSFAQYERELIGERTKDKLSAARRKGKFTGGHPVLGFDLDPRGGQLLVNNAEAEMVREVFQLFLEKRSLVQVADELNRRAWTLKRWTTKDGKPYGGGRFDKVSLRRLLTNHAYIGKVEFEGEVYDGEHAAIVAPKMFRDVLQVLAENHSTGGASHRNRYGALLRNILRCAACDSAMSFAPTKKGGRLYRYYRCSRSMKTGAASCPTASIPADRIEALVVAQIRRVGASPELQHETFHRVLAEIAAKRRGFKAEAKRLTKQSGELENTGGKLVHALADAIGDARRAVSNELEKAQEQHRSLEARLAETRAKETALAAQDIDEAAVARALEEFDALWEVLLTPERERVLQLLIARVTYNRATEELRIDLSPGGITTLQRELDGGAL